MSPCIERPRRHGSALLLAVVISAVVGVSVLALWRGTAAGARAIALEVATTHVDAVADSVRLRAFAFIDSGGWKRLQSPGDWQLVAARSAGGATWRAEAARMTWMTLLIRGAAETPGGARGVTARADHRTLVPLTSPIDFSDAALTGVQTWLVDAAATVDVPVAVGRERLCRSASGARAIARRPLSAAISAMRLPIVDADTVRDSLTGAFRLSTGRVRTPLRVRGIVVIDTEVSVEADLRVTGMLVARGSVHPAGGHIDVIGAVVAGDAGGGSSGLGAGDRVRYDACAIRSAVEQVTSRGPTATWTTLNVF